jgi:deoxyribodipyrimidine photo-lyase
MTRAFWFTRDLRLQDNAALNEAIKAAKADGEANIVPCYLLDATEFEALAGIRQHSIVESLKALSADIGEIAVFGSAAEMVSVLAQSGVNQVHCTESFDPAGLTQRAQLADELRAHGGKLHSHDSFYAVTPGLVKKPDGSRYRVYTPFFKGWLLEGWSTPKLLEQGFEWFAVKSSGVPKPNKPAPFNVRAGEAFALRTWQRFKLRALNRYEEDRNRADLAGTSHLSHALAFGEIHPRTLLAELGDSKAHEVFRKEIAWRELYADVLHARPDTTTDYYESIFAKMRYDVGPAADERLAAWQQGKTGYPMVDAGMRQLLADGWMHNRVRMIVASFLVKDLHLEWQQGADWFEQHLSDFDPASNAHGWQWTAGCGTDASPYYRVFNPVLQGLKFDPNGDYVRKYVPELAHIDGAAVHEPWLAVDGFSRGYPAPIVDHNEERNESLRRLDELKQLR